MQKLSRQETPKRATTRWLPEPLQESHKIIQNRHAKALVGHLTWPWNKNLLREPNKSLNTSTSNKDLHGRTPQKISPGSRQDLLTRTLTSSWSGSWHKDLYENIARSSKNDLHKSSKSLNYTRTPKSASRKGLHTSTSNRISSKSAWKDHEGSLRGFRPHLYKISSQGSLQDLGQDLKDTL